MVFIAHPSELGTLAAPGRIGGALGTLSPLPDSSVPGRRTPRPWPGRPRHRRRPGRHRAPHRCLLHRRHQMRGPSAAKRVVFPRGGMPVTSSPAKRRRPAGQGRLLSVQFKHAVHRRPLWRSRLLRPLQPPTSRHAAQGQLHLLQSPPTSSSSFKRPGRERWPSASAGTWESSGAAAQSSASSQLVHHPRRPRSLEAAPARYGSSTPLLAASMLSPSPLRAPMANPQPA